MLKTALSQLWCKTLARLGIVTASCFVFRINDVVCNGCKNSFHSQTHSESESYSINDYLFGHQIVEFYRGDCHDQKAGVLTKSRSFMTLEL